MSKLFDLSHKIIVVTGGSGQLGAEFCRTINANGGIAVNVDRIEPKHESDIPFFKADITKRSDLESAAVSIQNKLGPVYGLVNCAALDAPPNADASINGPFESFSEEIWQSCFDVNVKGVFLASQVFGGLMSKNRKGSIVNISSIYGTLSPDHRIYDHRRAAGEDFYKPSSYTATKSALYGLTKYLAVYWAKQNVRVNSVTLGGVFNGQHPDFVKAYSYRTPMGRMAEPTEYNGLIVFLLSSASSYITGSDITADGGFSSW